MDARGRSVRSRLGCPPEGGGYVVPGLTIPVGYCRQNDRCRRSSPKASAQPHRRLRVAPSKVRENRYLSPFLQSSLSPPADDLYIPVREVTPAVKAWPEEHPY